MDVIFDIDGTLADVSHRLHHLDATPRNKQGFNDAMEHDTVIEPIARVLSALDSIHDRIIICTARNVKYAAVTEKWLEDNRIFYDIMYMCDLDDHRPDYEVKSSLLDDMRKDGYNPVLVFDDRASVVKMWRERGLLCAAVAEGNF